MLFMNISWNAELLRPIWSAVNDYVKKWLILCTSGCQNKHVCRMLNFEEKITFKKHAILQNKSHNFSIIWITMQKVNKHLQNWAISWTFFLLIKIELRKVGWIWKIIGLYKKLHQLWTSYTDYTCAGGYINWIATKTSMFWARRKNFKRVKIVMYFLHCYCYILFFCPLTFFL